MDMGLLDSGFNCVLQMSTGSGKTWLADRTIEKTLNDGRRAIYVCPTRALAAERYEHWHERSHGYQVGIFTGDFGKSGSAYPVSFSEAHLLLMTPERLDSCTRNWRSHWDWIPETDLVVIDEFHLIGDGYRGARLEGALMRLRRLNPFLRIVALSATFGNREELAEWLDGVDYVANWRPVPLTWKYVHYKRAEEKPDLLVQEVHQTTRHGGKSLVFAQSRRRAEALAGHLKLNGFRASHHHAGLEYDTRRKIEHQFRGTDIDIVVATSTLEVGLNMPVRQVVLYDVQQFDGSDFVPLSKTKVWQRVGRAGRFGLDTRGEAVLFTPSWGGKGTDYEQQSFEPCQSSLANPRALAEQIVAELASGLSRTRTELRRTLSESLASFQNRLANVESLLDDMLKGGLLTEHDRTNQNEKEFRLKLTKIGRIASRHMLSPQTVLMFRTLLGRCESPTFFDLLIIACVSDDCDPVLPVSFEEIPSLSDQLACERSSLLNRGPHELPVLCGISPRRFLAALKMALAVRGYTRCGECEDVAEGLDCYPLEIKRVCESVERLLTAMASIAELTITTSNEIDVFTSPAEVPKKIRLLTQMVGAGLNEEEISLTFVPGIGTTWAKRLVGVGVRHVEDLAQCREDDLIALGGISRNRAKQWVEQAAHLMASDDIYLLRDVGEKIGQRMCDWPSEIDPYRLRRARSLAVRRAEHREFVVTGGSDPHKVVRGAGNIYECDCIDFAKGYRCKHLLAVQSHVGDKEVMRASSLMSDSSQSPTIDLFQLWMS